MSLRIDLGIEDQLSYTIHIAQIDKDKAAVVPPSVYPAGKRHDSSDIFFS
jgi:hypothetical protein